MTPNVIIVGAGQAGGEVATTLRQGGWTGGITIIGDEPHPPYQRPPLSKGFLLGKVSREQLHLKALTTYERFDIALRTDSTVTFIDRETHTIGLHDGTTLPYDKLVLATGGRPRSLNLPGLDKLDNVFALRRIDDADRLRPELVPGRRLILIGGGYVGLEIAAVAVQLGLSVTVVEAQSRALARVTGPEVSTFLEGVHSSHGVQFRFDSTVSGVYLDPDGNRLCGVNLLSAGVQARLDADLLLVGIGMEPNTELARAADLSIDNGISTDAFARTSDPDILAIGDCASYPNAYAGRRLRLESAPNAIEHAKVAAATLLERPKPTPATPWFWSDQYGLKLQMVGLSGEHDRCICRVDPAAGTMSAFYLAGDRLIAADVIGRPADFAAARRLVTTGVPIDAQLLADDTVPLAKVALEPSNL